MLEQLLFQNFVYAFFRPTGTFSRTTKKNVKIRVVFLSPRQIVTTKANLIFISKLVSRGFLRFADSELSKVKKQLNTFAVPIKLPLEEIDKKFNKLKKLP